MGPRSGSATQLTGEAIPAAPCGAGIGLILCRSRFHDRDRLVERLKRIGGVAA